ncbi:MAG: ROK family protein, partial [Candidatus Dormibacteraeota bacterium]|nr:ROK family protein [Candidatus Dormibacteraeota bacterium]
MSGEVVAVDLGGTHMRAAVVTPGGDVREHAGIDTPAADEHPDALVELIRGAREKCGAAVAVVGLPGRVNYRAGTLEYA